MKTIKELEDELKVLNSDSHVNWVFCIAHNKSKLQALKDVLGLIDDLEKSHGKHWFIKELKKRISG